MHYPMRKAGIVFGILFFMVSIHSGFAAEADQSELVKLSAYDNVFLSGYKLVLFVSQPSQVSDKTGYSTSSMTLSGDGLRHALQTDALGVDPVKFMNTKLHIFGRRDAAGNFMVSLPKTMSIYLDSEGGKIRYDKEVHILPKDKLSVETSADENTRIESFPAAHQDLLNQYFRYILPLGRGYSQLIDSLESVSAGGDGIEILKARGRLFSRYQGEWSLSIDTANDYSVMDASFKQDGASSPGFTMHGAAPLGKELKLNQSGTVQFGSYRIGVELVDFQPQGDQLFLNKMSARANDSSTYSDTASILDFHQLDGQGMPQVRRLEREVKRTAN